MLKELKGQRKAKPTDGDANEKSVVCLHNPGEILGCDAPDTHKTEKKNSLKICVKGNYTPKSPSSTPKS